MQKTIVSCFVLACVMAMVHSLPIQESVPEVIGELKSIQTVPTASLQDKLTEPDVEVDELSADRPKRKLFGGYGGYGGYGGGFRRFRGYGGGYGGYGGYGGGRGYGGYGFYGR